MDLKEELQRISKVIDDMPIEDFEKMLFDCGLGTIKPSIDCVARYEKVNNEKLFLITDKYDII